MAWGSRGAHRRKRTRSLPTNEHRRWNRYYREPSNHDLRVRASHCSNSRGPYLEGEKKEIMRRVMTRKELALEGKADFQATFGSAKRDSRLDGSPYYSALLVHTEAEMYREDASQLPPSVARFFGTEYAQAHREKSLHGYHGGTPVRAIGNIKVPRARRHARDPHPLVSSLSRSSHRSGFRRPTLSRSPSVTSLASSRSREVRKPPPGHGRRTISRSSSISSLASSRSTHVRPRSRSMCEMPPSSYRSSVDSVASSYTQSETIRTRRHSSLSLNLDHPTIRQRHLARPHSRSVRTAWRYSSRSEECQSTRQSTGR